MVSITALVNTTRREAYGLDELGNWASYKSDAGPGDENGGSWDLDQARVHNKANEIDTNDNHADTGASITGTPNWIDPVYDAAGNMTTAPQPNSPTSSFTCKYDAWNRLVEIKSGENYVAQYRFDGLNRRIRKFVPDESNWQAREYYYNNHWQALEVRKAMGVTRSGTPLAEPAVATGLYEQYVWSPAYIDAPVLRDRDADGNSGTGSYGRASSGLEERFEFTRDANMNVTAMVDSNGTPQERYVYDPYGKVTIYDGTWSNTRNSSSYDNDILFCGYMYDSESGLYNVRNRMYHPTLGRWNQRDPIAYYEGISLYEYVGSRPTKDIDPSGLFSLGELFLALTGGCGRSRLDCTGDCQRAINDKIGEIIAIVALGDATAIGLGLTVTFGKTPTNESHIGTVFTYLVQKAGLLSAIGGATAVRAMGIALAETGVGAGVVIAAAEGSITAWCFKTCSDRSFRFGD